MRGVSGLVGAAVVALIAVAAIASYAYLTAQQASQAARISASVASAAAAVKEDLTLYVNGSWVWAAPKVGNPRIVTYWYVWRGGRPSKPHPCNILLTGPKPIAPWPPNATDLIAKTALGNIYHLNIKPNTTITATEEYYVGYAGNPQELSKALAARYIPVYTVWSVSLLESGGSYSYQGAELLAYYPKYAPVVIKYVLPSTTPSVAVIVNDSLHLGKFVVGDNLTYGSEALIEVVAGKGPIYGRVYAPHPLVGAGVATAKFNLSLKNWVITNATIGSDRNASVTLMAGGKTITLHIGDTVPNTELSDAATAVAVFMDGVEIGHYSLGAYYSVTAREVLTYAFRLYGSGSVVGSVKAYYWYYGFRAGNLVWVDGSILSTTAVWSFGKEIGVVPATWKVEWSPFGLPVKNLSLVAPPPTVGLEANITLLDVGGAAIMKWSGVKAVLIGEEYGMPTYAIAPPPKNLATNPLTTTYGDQTFTYDYIPAGAVPLAPPLHTLIITASLYNATTKHVIWGTLQYVTPYTPTPTYASGTQTSITYDVAGVTKNYAASPPPQTMSVSNAVAKLTYATPESFTIADPGNPNAPSAHIETAVITSTTGTTTANTTYTTQPIYTPPPPNPTVTTTFRTAGSVLTATGKPLKIEFTVCETPPGVNLSDYPSYTAVLTYDTPVPVPEGGYGYSTQSYSYTWAEYTIVKEPLTTYYPNPWAALTVQAVFTVGVANGKVVPMLFKGRVVSGTKVLAYIADHFNFAGTVTYTTSVGRNVVPITVLPKPTAMVWWGAVGVFMLFGFGDVALVLAVLRGRGVDVVGRVREVVGGGRIEWGAYIASLVCVFVLLALA